MQRKSLTVQREEWLVTSDQFPDSLFLCVSHSQLFHHSNFSSSQGSTEDLFRDSIDSCDIDITEKVLEA